MKENCYKCIHRRDIPGDCHSSCAKKIVAVSGNEHGIKNGWFFHPYNFDPVWLTKCYGYTEKDFDYDSAPLEDVMAEAYAYIQIMDKFSKSVTYSATFLEQSAERNILEKTKNLVIDGEIVEENVRDFVKMMRAW